MFALGAGGNIFVLCSVKHNFVEEQMFVQLLVIFAAFHIIRMHIAVFIRDLLWFLS